MSDTDDDLDATLDDVHEHLQACLELPVERTASRWIGEAEAVARDLAEADLDEDVVEERLGHVRDLLAEVEETGNARATEHVEVARELTDSVLADLA